MGFRARSKSRRSSGIPKLCSTGRTKTLPSSAQIAAIYSNVQNPKINHHLVHLSEHWRGRSRHTHAALPGISLVADSLERALPRPVPFQPSGRLDERYQQPLVLQWRIPHDFSALPAWPQLESDALGARGQHRHAALGAETDRTRARGHNAPGDCFSCSVVVDSANTAGFKTGTEDEFVAVYTATKQGTCLAYSNDKGATWQG